jgi:hypothetical protein
MTHPLQATSTHLRLSLRSLALALAAALALPSAVQAWGPHGHRITARVAQARLTPAARAAVRELLHKGDTLVDISTWADDEGHDAVPGSAPWHYVNVPITATRYDPHFCSGGGCVVARIKHFRSVLVDRRARCASASEPFSSWFIWSRTSISRCTSAITTTRGGTTLRSSSSARDRTCTGSGIRA